MTNPRQPCPECGKPNVAVKKDGTLWRHRTWPPRKWGRLSPYCKARLRQDSEGQPNGPADATDETV